MTAAFDAAYGMLGTGNSSRAGSCRERGQPTPDATFTMTGSRDAPQQRQRGLRDPDDPDDVRVQHGGHRRGVEVVDAEGGAEHAGVVDEHVELGQGRDRRVDGVGVGDVERTTCAPSARAASPVAGSRIPA